MQNTIFQMRKDLKKRGHATVKRHYLLLVFLMLVMVLFGTEFQTSLYGWGKISGNTQETGEPNPGNMLSDSDVVSPQIVLRQLREGNLTSGEEKAFEQAEALQNRFADSRALGLTNGVFAELVNSIGSGGVFVRLAQTIRTITRSDRVTGIIFTIGSFFWWFLVFVFLKNVYSAVIRRAFLTARIYPHLSSSDVTWFAIVGKWISASLTMALMNLYHTLWKLTIVGAFVKFYSYWAVPYLVAENPALSPNEAITISRKMMDGHKMELFKYQLTFLGWRILGLVTFGISNLLYGNAYMLAAEAEYYAMLRRESLEKMPELQKALNDPWLFAQADRISLTETYFDVVEEITDIHENRVTIGGWRAYVAGWLGVWLYGIKKKKAYDAQEERSLALQRDKLCMEGRAYPQRLNPLWKMRKKTRPDQFSYIRSYTVWTLVLIFLCLCFIGWSWEVALHFMQEGQLVNRGTLHGPWLPIYGTGGILVLLLCTRFRKKPAVEFLVSILLCGTLEYVSAWQLEMKYHQRWWSYDGYFLNLHGRICAEGLLVFGVGCCVVVYLAAPALDHMFSRLKEKTLIIASLVLGILYVTDLTYSQKHPNMAEGAIERQEELMAYVDNPDYVDYPDYLGSVDREDHVDYLVYQDEAV